MEGLSFCISGEYYAADVTLVQKTARKLNVSHVPAAPDEVIGITNVNGKAVTILDVKRLIYGTEGPPLWPGTGVQVLSAVIFKPFFGGDDRMGFAIDRLGDLLTLNEDKISPPQLRHISGVVERGGEIYRIIDIASVINRYKDETKV